MAVENLRDISLQCSRLEHYKCNGYAAWYTPTTTHCECECHDNSGECPICQMIGTHRLDCPNRGGI